MITYVDTSVLIKLLVAENGSDQAREVWERSPRVASVTLVLVESAAALAAAERSGRLTSKQHDQLLTACDQLADQMTLVQVTAELIGLAVMLAREEALRGYDSVHLAAALTIDSTVFTTADAALCAAAQRRGLHVAKPLAV